jgi:anion-transporting  ArsA/GET3 family ATPase
VSAADTIEKLLERRLLIVIGKGGVGRTSISAALGLVVASRGQRVLLIEASLITPIAAAYGQSAGFEPVELRPRLFSMALHGQQSLEEYLSFVVPKPILRAVFATSFYRYFVQAVPAVRELTMMGKVFHEIERRSPSLPPWDLVIFDAPASGQALSLLRMPFAARETFGDALVGREAIAIGELLRDSSKCAIVAVTTAEQLALAETIESCRALRELELHPAALFFNRTSPTAFDSTDITRTLERYGGALIPPDREYLTALARAELARRSRERRALALLRRGLACPIIPLKEDGGVAGASLFDALARQLGT